MANEEGSKRSGEKLIEVEIADASNGWRKSGLLLRPVLPQEEGEGLPYAPENWPNQGDIWGWRVGRRVAGSGYYLDRYLYPPSRFQKSNRKRDGFASKLSVEQYVRGRFPGTDVNAFFSSFSWKIPSKQAYLFTDEHGSFGLSSEEMAEQSPPDLFPDAVRCKAGNRFCPSLLEDQRPPVAAQSCDICCSEPGFCRDCSCILCCKTINLAFGGYSFIRCETIVHDNLICGHVAHLHCALRAYMAGTVGGTIGYLQDMYSTSHVNSGHTGMGAVNCIYPNEFLKFEEEIDQVLLQLKSSQDHAYRMTQNMLHAQKDRFLSLHQQVYKEKSELEQPTPSTNRDALLSSIAAKEEQMNRELSKLRDIEKVVKEIGKASKQRTSQETFELDLKD